MLSVKNIINLLPAGLAFWLRSLYYGIQIRLGKFVSNEKEFTVLGRLVKKGDWVLDIGANVGHYTLSLSSLVG